MSSPDGDGTEVVTDTAQPSSTQRIGQTVGRRAADTTTRARLIMQEHPSVSRVYRVGIGLVGGGTVALGVILMPLPGPGTLIGLGGLALLATQFNGAKKVQTRAVATARKAAAQAKGAASRRRGRGATPQDDSGLVALQVGLQPEPSTPPLSAK